MGDAVYGDLEKKLEILKLSEKAQILSKTEIEKTVKCWKDYEFKICGFKKRKQDFIDYVMYDDKLLRLIEIRRKKHNIRIHKEEIDKKLKRITASRLYFMSKKFLDDPNIWKMRIDFLKRIGFISEVRECLMERLNHYNNVLKYWIELCDFEISQNNFQEARNILTERAVKFHPNSLELSKKHFELEIKFVRQLKEKKDISNIQEEIPLENRQKVLDGCLITLVYEHAITIHGKEVVDEAFDIVGNSLNIEFLLDTYEESAKMVYDVKEQENEEDMAEYARRKEIEEVLKKSEVLKPDFEQKMNQQNGIGPYVMSRRAKKKRAKEEREATAGKDHFNMKAPERTDEVENDLEIIKNRSVLFADRHYKQSHVKYDHFHIGKVVDSPFDVHDRVPNKQRKQTLAEEIMNNEDALRFQKRQLKKFEYAMPRQQRTRKGRKNFKEIK